MQHVDEHIVELYYLGGLDDQKLRNEVEAHLTECYSCNELYTKIRDFYQEVENVNSLNPKETKLLGTNSLVTRPNFIPAFHFLPNSVKNLINNFLIYIITRPVKSSLNLVVIAGLLYISFNFDTLFKSSNPFKFNVRSASERVDFYNNQGDSLYSLRYDLIEGYDVSNLENTFNIEMSALTDLNNDGKNEFITILHNADNGEIGIDKLHVYRSNGDLLYSKKIGRNVGYGNNVFDAQFENKAVIVDDFDKDGSKEIYVLSRHRNSPVVVTKMDNNGNWVGEYWHYGWFWGFNKIKLGQQEGILLCGINDKDSSKRYPIISFIDPTKIKGQMQSSQTLGFESFTPLNEINYKYFPIITPQAKGIYKPRINNMLNTDNQNFVNVVYYFNAFDALGDITLDKDFNINGIKIIDAYTSKFGEFPKADLDLLLKK